MLCGTFRTGPGAVTRISLTAPSVLDGYTGWIVTAGAPGRTRRVLLAT